MADIVAKLTFSDNVETTLQDFADLNNLVFDNQFTINDLLTFEGNDRRIFAAYTIADQQQYSSADVALLRAPVTLRFPSVLRKTQIASPANNPVTKNVEYKAFLADKLLFLLQHQGYKPITELSQQSIGFQSLAYKIYNNCSVWIWCRALGDKSTMINVTPFVENVQTTLGDNGGNFSFNLAPLIAQYDTKDGWVISKASLMEYAYQGKKNYAFRESLIKQIRGIDGTPENKRKLMYFHHILSPNDMVFIQFETLDMERNQRMVDDGGDLTFSNGLQVSNAALPDKVFDMIGLIDSSAEQYNSADAHVTVSVTGRDLMKTLIEDGCYFYPLDFAVNSGGFINGGASNGTAMRRLITGELMFFNAFVDRSIAYSLSFIINQLCNVEIVPSELFRYYTDKSQKFLVNDETLAGQANLSVVANPYTSNSSQFTKEDAEGVWQIIKLSIDSEIADRRIVDSSITVDQGSLISFFKKVCQEPFVEFWGDTYGDQYHFIVRKPPYSQASIKDYISRELCIDIYEGDIYSEDMSFDDSNVYSWFHLVPMGSYAGDTATSFLDFPPIFFEQFAKVWGSRPLQVTSNYVKYEQFQGKESKVNLDYMREQALNDLAFMIETNAYLPFTRKGTIQIKRDRRIKRGMFVRHNGTGEIFHVDSVNNTFSVNKNSTDGETHLVVSRGMVEEYLDGAKNYFNIVDLKKDSKGVPKDENFKVNDDVFEFFLTKQQFK